MLTLKDAVEADGFQFVIDPTPFARSDVLGNPSPASSAVACEGNVLACIENSWDHAFACSHEMAEAFYGFKHCEGMWCYQANILARWHRYR